MQMKFPVTICFLLCCQLLFGQPKDDILQYIEQYKELAISEMQRTGVPASIKLAQGIHETFAGKSDLVLKSNNHFGIKCKNTWTGNKVYHDDDASGECFRSYSTAADSYTDHSNFLRSTQRYAFLFDLDPTDYKSWAYGLKTAGYATNSHYSQILIKLIEDFGLQKYSLWALGKLSDSDEIIVNDLKFRSPISDNDPIFIPKINYPEGQFILNKTRVIFARAGNSLLKLSEEFDISLARLLEFNDLKNEEVLTQDQLIFLQRKRKTGANQFHTVQAGENLYWISQSEGIRMEALLDYNHLNIGLEPAVGEKLYLHGISPVKPKLRNETAELSKPLAAASVEFMPALSKTHIVQTKETLYSIAKKYQVNVEQLQEWNGLNATGLKTGQQLFIYKN